MIRLYDKGIFLLNGKTIVQEGAPDLNHGEAKKQTIAYGILKDHNTNSNMDFLKHRLDGTLIPAESADLTIRMMAMQKPHGALAMTGAMCTAAAAVVEGSVVQEILRADADTQYLRLGHPGDILEVCVDHHQEDGRLVMEDTLGFRTANLLMPCICTY